MRWFNYLGLFVNLDALECVTWRNSTTVRLRFSGGHNEVQVTIHDREKFTEALKEALKPQMGTRL